LHSVLILFAILLPRSALAENAQICEGRSYAVSDGYNLVCPATWKFKGRCNGLDMWNRWTVTGRTNSSDYFVRPWASTPIMIIGCELVKLQRNSWFG